MATTNAAVLQLTQTQMTVLRAFTLLAARLGRPPITREIAAHVGRNSPSVHAHIHRLLDVGALVYTPPQGMLPFAAQDQHKRDGYIRSRYVRPSDAALAVLSRDGRACPFCGKDLQAAHA